jgi:lysozyme family protein
MTDEQIIDGILAHEGSAYADIPGDKGGPTKYGVTLRALEEFRGQPVTAAEVEALTENEARKFYQFEYIEKPGFDYIVNQQVRALVADCGVNHGVRNAIILLQRAAGVKDDGDFGPVTLEAVNHADGRALYLRLCAARARFYGKIVTHDPTQAKFDAGWMDRLADFIEAAAPLTGESAPSGRRRAAPTRSAWPAASPSRSGRAATAR